MSPFFLQAAWARKKKRSPPPENGAWAGARDTTLATLGGTVSDSSDSFSDRLESIGREAKAAGPPAAYNFGRLRSESESFRGLAAGSYQAAPPPPGPTSYQAEEQLQHLEETKVLLSALNQTMQNSEADRRRADLDRSQQSLFNKRMTIVAIALSMAAVIAPFLVYFLEHGWWWEAYRP